MIYLIIGPSGSGKSTFVNFLEELGLFSIYSYTTRPERYPGEGGHIFVSDIEFDNLENKVAYTEFNGYRYCATAEQIENCDLYVIDPLGVQTLRNNYKGKEKFRMVYLEASEETCRERMAIRGDSETQINERIINDRTMIRDKMNDLYGVKITIDANQDMFHMLQDFFFQNWILTRGEED